MDDCSINPGGGDIFSRRALRPVLGPTKPPNHSLNRSGQEADHANDRVTSVKGT